MICKDTIKKALFQIRKALFNYFQTAYSAAGASAAGASGAAREFDTTFLKK